MNIIVKNIIFNKYLKKAAYALLSSPIADLSLYQYFYQKQLNKKMLKYDQRPISINIENTNICNGACEFCPHSRMQREKGIMEMGLFKKIVDQVKSWGIGTIAITGFGEPLLDPHFFERVRYSKNKGIDCVFANVNSIFITEEIAEKLHSCGIDQIYISCNKRGEVNAKRFCSMKKNGKPLIYLSGIKGEFEPRMYPGADGVSISYPHNWSGEVSRHLKKSRRDPCKMIWQAMYITWDGKVILCCLDYDARCVIGDVNRESLREIWGNDKIKIMKKLHKEKNFSTIPICASCTNNNHNKAPWWV